jgi:phage gp36-like protein
MDFLTTADFKAVCDDATLNVIHQADVENLARAERYAQEEVSSYLRSGYDIAQAYQKEGDDRNEQLIMITCDIALYHLVAWLPKRIGFEIREIRYNRAISWLKDVQAGKATPDLPTLTNDQGEDIGNPVRYGGWEKSTYDY